MAAVEPHAAVLTLARLRRLGPCAVMEREHPWARTLSVTTAAARTEPLGVDFVEGEEEEGRKEAHPNLNPGPSEVRAANGRPAAR